MQGVVHKQPTICRKKTNQSVRSYPKTEVVFFKPLSHS